MESKFLRLMTGLEKHFMRGLGTSFGGDELIYGI